MIFPQCQSSQHDTTHYDAANIITNYELTIMNYEEFQGIC